MPAWPCLSGEEFKSDLRDSPITKTSRRPSEGTSLERPMECHANGVPRQSPATAVAGCNLAVAGSPNVIASRALANGAESMNFRPCLRSLLDLRALSTIAARSTA